MNRRTVLAGAGTIGLSSLAGCLGVVGLDEHHAGPAGVTQATREETGYELTGVEELVVEEPVGMLVTEERVSVANRLTEYDKAVDMGLLGRQRGAVFMLLTTPQVSILGRDFNPVGEMGSQELVELVEDNYDDISNIAHQRDDEVTILEQETVSSTFDADAQFDGVAVDVTLQITEAVESGEDLLVAIAVYPDQVALLEQDNVDTLFDGIVDDLEAATNGEPPDDGDGTGNDDSTDDGSDGHDDVSDGDDGATDDDSDELGDDGDGDESGDDDDEGLLDV
ncbi:hypothetical protein D8Y22_07550 [Salinadaptatus halalkaliphilus]|uniref:Prokaryotic membrane lipoprotein lipid attachment site profile n=1 Tax=Salinadaptatus halalkaliphilus TaxID=2419781 RepID=A0A4S3TLN2_9EURY|nr:DUF6517 family protein [Salinadaptatus halalkaliphilus]THE65072.1 hypothetical protein D8Y22_07550 [Salinadaptatus halalkaliphilus]